MPGQFDTTTRYLVEEYPADWLAYLGLDTSGSIDVIDANLSVVSAEVDKVVRVRAEAERLVHLEFQSSYDPTMSRRLLRYNAMLHLPRLHRAAGLAGLHRRAGERSARDAPTRAAGRLYADRAAEPAPHDAATL